MTKPISSKALDKISTLPKGVAFASNSLRFQDVNKNSIEKELSRLNSNGIVKRFRKGIYYKPQQSSFFGDVLPSPASIAHAIGKLNNAHIVPHGSMVLNLNIE